MKKCLLILLSLTLTLGWITGLYAADWPQWRGPNGDGISTETDWNPKALDGRLKILWESDVGIGYSSFSVKGDRLYTMGNIEKGGNQTDVIYCLNAKTGKEIWRHEYTCEQGGWPGPRATPTIDGNYIYTISRSGHVYCLNAQTGSVIWTRDLVAENMAVDPDCGISGSAVIYNDKVIFNAGGRGIAMNKKTGDVLWHSGAEKCGFASPVLYDWKGETRIALLSRTDLYSLDPNTGKVHWTIPWITRYEENSVDPIISGNKLFLSTGYGRECALLELTGSKPRTIWQNANMSNHFHNSILINGHLFGIDGVMGKKTALHCLDIDTGELKWSIDHEFGPVVAAAGKLILLNEMGMLRTAEATEQGYKEISATRVLPAPNDIGVPRNKRNRCWAPPVLANGLIYVRNTYGNIVCIDIKS